MKKWNIIRSFTGILIVSFLYSSIAVRSLNLLSYHIKTTETFSPANEAFSKSNTPIPYEEKEEEDVFENNNNDEKDEELLTGAPLLFIAGAPSSYTFQRCNCFYNNKLKKELNIAEIPLYITNRTLLI